MEQQQRKVKVKVRPTPLPSLFDLTCIRILLCNLFVLNLILCIAEQLLGLASAFFVHLFI